MSEHTANTATADIAKMIGIFTNMVETSNKNTIQELDHQKQNMMMLFNVTNTEIRQLDKRLSNVEGKVDHMQVDIDTMKSDISTMQADIATIKSDISTILELLTEQARTKQIIESERAESQKAFDDLFT